MVARISRRALGLAMAGAMTLGGAAFAQGARQPADMVITGGAVITMDAERRILDDGAVAIVGGRIAAVGTSAEIAQRYAAKETIDARRKVIMPGLIDGHGHAGHAMLKTLGMDIDQWIGAAEKMYAHGSTPAFWRADAQLTGLERLKGGVTTSVNLFGGGSDVSRVDEAAYGEAYLDGIKDVGVRWIFGVGPRRWPYPSAVTNWTGDSPRPTQVGFEKQMAVTEGLIRKWNNAADGRVKMAVMFPTIKPQEKVSAEVVAQAKLAREMSKREGVLFLQDGHTTGTIKLANEMGLLGPDALFSHATEITPEEIALVASTGTKISHNPSAIFSIQGRNPTTELIDAGAVVMLGSDGAAPDRGYDMFRHMFQATRYHRFHFRDPSVLPAGKVLEMTTIDAAKALGMEKDIGSLEAGKKADIILVDWFKPHLAPMNMPTYRMVYFANGADVDTVLVDGRVVMRGRKVLTVDEEAVLTTAQNEADLAIKRAGLEDLTRLPDGFWGASRLKTAPGSWKR